jgi:hypothetical protein
MGDEITFSHMTKVKMDFGETDCDNVAGLY